MNAARPHSGRRGRDRRRNDLAASRPTRRPSLRQLWLKIRRPDGCRTRGGTSSHSRARRPTRPTPAPNAVRESRTSLCSRVPIGRNDAWPTPSARNRSRSSRKQEQTPSNRCSTDATRPRRLDTRRSRTTNRNPSSHSHRACHRGPAGRLEDIVPIVRRPGHCAEPAPSHRTRPGAQ